MIVEIEKELAIKDEQIKLFDLAKQRLEKELAIKDEQIKLFEERISLFNSLPWYGKIWFVLTHEL